MKAELHKIEDDLREMALSGAGVDLSLLGAQLYEEIEKWLDKYAAFESWCERQGVS